MFYEASGQWANVGLLAKNVPTGSMNVCARLRYSAGMSFRRAIFRLVMAILCGLPPASPLQAIATPGRASCDAAALQIPLVAWTAPLSKTARLTILAVRRRLDRLDSRKDSLFGAATDVSWVKEWLKGEDIPAVPNVIALTLETMYEMLVLGRQQDYYNLTLEEGREMIQKAVIGSATLIGGSPQAIEFALLNFFSRSDEESARLWGDLKRAFLHQIPRPMRDDFLGRLQVRKLLQRQLDRERVVSIGRLMRKPQEPASDHFHGTPDALRWTTEMFVGVASVLFMAIGIVVYWGWRHSLSMTSAATTLMATVGLLMLFNRIARNEHLLRYYDDNKERIRDWDFLKINLDHRPWLPESDARLVPGLTDIEQTLAQFCAAVDGRDAVLLRISIDYLREQIDAQPQRGNPSWDVLPNPIRREFIAWLQEDPHAIHWRDWVGLWTVFYGFANPASPEAAVFRRAA